MSCWSLQLQGKVFNGVEVISTSHVNVEKKIHNLDGRVCRFIVLLDVNGFKPFRKLVLHYFISKAHRVYGTSIPGVRAYLSPICFGD